MRFIKTFLLSLIFIVILSGCLKKQETTLPPDTNLSQLIEEVSTLRKKINQLEKKNTLFSQKELPAFITAAEKVKNSVVFVNTIVQMESRWGQPVNAGGTGSGVIISEDGYIVTNNHVIEGATSVEISLLDKRTFTAKIVGVDPTTDLALLKIETNGLPAVSFGDSDLLEIGEWVLAVGNPLNLTSTVTAGIVSAKGRNINILAEQYSVESFIQTDAVVNPGNSGGALVDATGNLVGINTAILTQSGRYEGYSFAVPVNLVKKVAEDLKVYGVVQRAILGVSIRDLTSSEATALKLAVPKGALVERVFENGAASDAGIKNGDIIMAINGKTVNNYIELQEIVARYRPGDNVDVDILSSNNKMVKKTIQLKNRNNSIAITEKPEQLLLEKYGIEVRELSIAEINNYRLKGVKIISVKKGKPVDLVGIKPDFIIVTIDKEKIDNVNALASALNKDQAYVIVEGLYPKTGEIYKYKLRKE